MKALIRILICILTLNLSGVVIAQKVTLPPNAGIDIYGSGWTCNRGFKQVGSECQKVTLPQNAGIDIYGSGWTCNRGFKQVGSECQKVTLPQNAGIDIYGSGWTCNRGFKQVGNECQKLSENEMKAVVERERVVAEELNRRRAQGVSGQHCDTESKSGANVCVTVRDAEIGCSETFSKSYFDSCKVEVSFRVETDYKGSGYIDGKIKCEVDISTSGRSGYETSMTDDEKKSISLYAFGSENRSVEVDFSFSSFNEIRKVRVTSANCRVRDLSLY